METKMMRFTNDWLRQRIETDPDDACCEVGGAPDLPRVLNKKRDGVPDGAVYIGRPSKWGNPFVVGKDGTRDEVVRKYETWICESVLLSHVHELRGKDLVCWCKPAACHGDVLLRLANQ